MSPPTDTPFLDVAALAPLTNMRFASRHRIEGTYGGQHRSRVLGGAGEFSDFREYTEGEDPRHVDWRVYARTGRAYLRLFQDETNLRAVVAIDGSRSMRFGMNQSKRGSLSKLEYVQFLSSALAYMIVRQQDQVGVAVLADSLEEFIAPGGTNEHAAVIFKTIAAIEPKATTTFAAGLTELFQRLSQTGVLIVMSDFLVDDLDDVFAAVRLFRHRRWDVVILHIIHPDEERLPTGVALRFEGLEDDGVVQCSPSDVGDAYEKRFASHVAMIRARSLAAGCNYHRVSTTTPYLEALGKFLVARSG